MNHDIILRILEVLVPPAFSIIAIVTMARMERKYKEASINLDERRVELEADAAIRRDLIALVNTYKEHSLQQDSKIAAQEARIKCLEESETLLKNRIVELERLLAENGIQHK